MARFIAQVEGFGIDGNHTYRSMAVYDTPGDLLVHLLCQQNNVKTVQATAVVGNTVTHIAFSKRKPFKPPKGWWDRVSHL